MPKRRFVLASASPARLRVLRDAGLDPEVVVTGVDEEDHDGRDTRETVSLLARRKAEAAAASIPDALVLGCDSLLDLDGTSFGKAASPDAARARWQQMRGRRGTLFTGHCLVDTAAGASADEVGATAVCFGAPTDAEIDAYVATGEPTRVAGAFTLDGYAAPFVDAIDGDHGTVLGLSMPLLRRLCARLDVEITDLWA